MPASGVGAVVVGWVYYPLMATALGTLCCGVNVMRKALSVYMGWGSVDLWEIDILNRTGVSATQLGLMGTLTGTIMAMSHLSPGDPSTMQFLYAGMAEALYSSLLGLEIYLVAIAFAALADRVEQWDTSDEEAAKA